MEDPAHLREEWQDIQSTFVDDPAGSVRRAADLTENAVRVFIASVEERAHDLHASWNGREPDTEALRNALRSYRVCVDRLARM
jgi:hypothetical protein